MSNLEQDLCSNTIIKNKVLECKRKSATWVQSQADDLNMSSLGLLGPTQGPNGHRPFPGNHYTFAYANLQS